MRVLGVLHSTRIPPLSSASLAQRALYNIHPEEAKKTNELAFILARVNELKRESLKIGFEGNFTEKDLFGRVPKNPTERFAKGLFLLAKRNKIPFISLETGEPQELLLNLELPREEAPLSPREQRFAERLVSEASKLSDYKQEDLENAVLVYRSKLLVDKARKEGCSLIIVGGTHARDLEKLEGNEGRKHEYFYSPLAQEGEKKERLDYYRRLRAFKRYRGVINRVLQAMPQP